MSACSYQKYYDEHCTSIDARSFTSIRKTVFSYIEDEACPYDVKIQFGDWLFRKIYMNYKPMTHVKRDICGKLIPSFEECQDLVPKATYLKFHDVIAMSLIAENFYTNRFVEKDKFFALQIINDTQLIKNYLQSSVYSSNELKDHFVRWIERTELLEQRSNLLDVLLLNFGNDPRVIEIHDEMKGVANGTIYENEQNVHDEGIHQSATDAAGELVKWYGETICGTNADDQTRDPRVDWLRTFIRGMCKSEEDHKITSAVLDRVDIDLTSFITSDDVTFGLYDVMIAIARYIYYNDKVADELSEILVEEMKDMVELCASGYVARVINVLQGFDDRYTVSISAESQLYAVLSHSLATGLDKAPERVLEGSVGGVHHGAYLEFIRKLVQSKIHQLIADYGKEDVILYIAGVVTKLSGVSCEFSPESLTLKMVSASM